MSDALRTRAAIFLQRSNGIMSLTSQIENRIMLLILWKGQWVIARQTRVHFSSFRYLKTMKLGINSTRENRRCMDLCTILSLCVTNVMSAQFKSCLCCQNVNSVLISAAVSCHLSAKLLQPSSTPHQPVSLSPPSHFLTSQGFTLPFKNIVSQSDQRLIFLYSCIWQ